MIYTALGQLAIGIIITFVGYTLNRKSKQIHLLVNSRLDEALRRINELENRLDVAPDDKFQN